MYISLYIMPTIKGGTKSTPKKSRHMEERNCNWDCHLDTGPPPSWARQDPKLMASHTREMVTFHTVTKLRLNPAPLWRSINVREKKKKTSYRECQLVDVRQIIWSLIVDRLQFWHKIDADEEQRAISKTDGDPHDMELWTQHPWLLAGGTLWDMRIRSQIGKARSGVGV